MALLQTLSEIKAILPKLVSNLNDESLLPNFDAAEVKYLVPITGYELYNDLVTKYSGNTLSNEEKMGLKHMQLLVGANAFRDDMIVNQVMWTDQGLRTITTQEMGKPVGWEFKKLEDYFNNKALDAEEILLTYLWANKASYPKWTASDEYKEFTTLLIKTGTEFSKVYKLYQPMRTYYALQTVARDVQDEYLAAGIGADLLNYLRDMVNSTSSERDCLWLLKKSLAFLTIKRASQLYNVRFSEAGFTTVTAMRPGDQENSDTAGRSGADMRTVEEMMRANEMEGQNYLSKARYELYKYRKSSTSGNDFNTAFDKGPLVDYVEPGERGSGNDTRKIFILGG
jgi:hypothetical protein